MIHIEVKSDYAMMATCFPMINEKKNISEILELIPDETGHLSIVCNANKL